MISYLRRHAAPVALVTYVAMLSSLLPRRAMADEEQAAAPAPAAPPVATAVVAPKGTGDHGDSAPAPKGSDVVLPKEPLQVESLPSGADKSGVTSQSISVPQGAGKISGMGESFSAQLSTGIATYSVPISLPAARGGAQPSLGLSYSSSLGHGVAGIGWEIGAPFIARQTDRGLARYDDPAPGGPWKPTMDRFVFNGGQELIPICLVGGDLSCAGAQAGEVMPAWSASHLYFRARVEGSYLRFFWSPDHKTWRVQDKSGLSMELGVPLNESAYEDGLERDPVQPAHIYKWNLVRQYDAQGNANPASGAPTPNNAVVFRWAVVEGMGYLTEIYDTSPAANPSAPLTDWAHHTVLNYEARTDPTTSYRRGWRTRSTLRLQRIDVASKTFGNAAGREMLRRYYFGYNAAFHPSLLESVQIEGRCSSTVVEDSSQSLPASACPRLPPMTFGYQHVDGYDGNGNPQGPTLTGYEAIDERVHTIASSPKHSLDESLVDLFDIDSDGLPDVLATWPLAYSGKHAVFFHGAGGQVDTFAAAQLMAVHGIQGANAQIISLDNSNVVPQDLDGDGTVDLLHMPQVKDYAIYTPTYLNGQWSWEGRPVTTASQQSPKIDFTKNRPQSKVMDVDGDGLVDVVYSAGTQYQTFFSLGRHPDGDGQFGFATRTSATTSAISNDPVTSCVPYAGTAVSLSDPDVRIGDMNGDGFPDIVRIRQGDIKYWPGRGNGMWGTGDPTTCPAGTFAQSRDVPMTQSPMMVAVNTDELRLDDVNGDGLDDLVQVRFNAVDIWLNVDGVSWTPTRHTMLNTPPSSLKDRARLVDMNGSGTRDVVWGDGYAYKYIDLAGGRRPWVLTRVDNGLGKTTDLEYSTSVQQMLAAQAANEPWQSKMPTVAHVVTKVTERDNLGVAGRPDGVYVTDYEYRDPVFDGQQREFRGFRTARVTREGDANGPSAVTESMFLLGECKDENGIDECSLPERWRDNPREALKGLPVVSEVRDLSGTTLSTTHHTYRLRQLYQGLDGRAVRVAFESATDSYAYDTGPFVPGASIETLPEVELEASLGTVTADASRAVTLRSGGRVHVRGSSTVDAFGNATTGTAEGCVAGCPTVDEAITTVTTPARRPDDPTGWMFRTVESYVTGSSAPNVKRKRSLTTYDVFGNPTQVQADLFGTLPLDRFHENVSKSVAAAPAGASQDGLISLGSTTYDAFGNTTGTTAPNQRCRTVTYDTPFAQLATSETVFAGAPGGSCGGVLLSAGAAYDRGFALVTQVQDLHNEITLVAYDGFGRLSSMTKPDPSQTGTPSALPSVKVEYFLTASPSTQPYSLIHTETQDGATPAANSYRNAWAYVDGMGRPIVTLDQADPGAGDAGDWVVNGLTDYDAKGEARKVYLAWFATGAGNVFPLSAPASTQGQTQRYDAFGRPLEKTHLDNAVILRTVYHALSEDSWDAADLTVGPRYGTYATVRKDGHGRGVEMIERVHVGSSIEERKTLTTYLPSGEPRTLTRQRGSDTVTRWMSYDSLGRLVLNVDPHTTVGFNADPGTDPSTLKAWRYAYNDNGDLVGTSDARGCGENFAYDTAGRLLTEDYSPCMNAHADYTSSPEVANRYDFVDPDIVPNFTIDASLLRGRLVSVSDRAQKTLTRFDGRGRVTGIARRVAVPSAPGTYAPRWYTQTATFDGADRPVDQTTGAAVSELLGQGAQSFVSTDYTKRGTVKSVGGSYGTLVTGVLHDADGLPTRIEYGDLAQTTTDFTHDVRRRLSTVQTYRGPPVEWTTPPVSYAPAPNLSGSDKVFQSILEDGEYLYDEVDNPTEIRDHRNPDVWPAGAKPVTKKATYDDLYRLTDIRYEYAAGDDTWVDPFDAETTGTNPDPHRAIPSPHVAFDKRVLEQTYAYDWLGNLTTSGDDAAGFYDRSVGTQSHSGTKPYQLTAATGAVSTRDGSLTLAYDATGNTTSMSLVRHGACLPSTAVCSQRFAYDWDEVGRLSRARRWDLASPGVASDPLPQGTPAVDLRYTYDASDSRILKTAVDAASNELHTVYVFASLELRRAIFDNGDFTDTKDTEVAYLFAHGVRLARLHYSEDSLPTLTSGKLHVLLELPDHLGSSSIVVDKETGELAERSTYQAYGGADSDYRPDRWGSFREDYRFTGKEEDAEVGLDYFGKRYLAVGLNRWLSADPLAVHAPGSADLNLYAYVHGAVLRAIDPLGLTDVDRQANQQQATSTSSSPTPMLKAGLDKLVAGWGSFRAAVTNLVKSDDFDSNYEQSKKLQAVNVPEPIKGLNDGLMEHTPGATVNLGLIAVAGMQGGAPVRVSNTPAGGAGAPTGGSPPPTSLPRAAADGVGGTGAGVAGTKPIAPPPPADPVAPPPAKLPDAIGKSASAQADVNAFADAAGKAMKDGAGGEHGPFIHGINKGGLSDIVRTQQMVASDARMTAGGTSAVRAYATSLDKLGPNPPTDFLEFTTERAPTEVNHGQSSVSWWMAPGQRLDIKISRIAHTDGSVTILFP